MTPPSASPSRALSRRAAAFAPSASGHSVTADPFDDGLPVGWDASADSSGVLQQVFDLARLVHRGTACDLPGVSIQYDTFVPAMWRAVRSGHVASWAADFVQDGLDGGFRAGLSREHLRGQRVFRNYESATGEFRGRVTDATEARVAAGRTLDLGAWVPGVTRELLHSVFGDFFIFPMGAVAKRGQRNKARPTDDHTRTGLNAATDMSLLSHSLDTYREIARLFLPGHAMAVTDVESAFQLLPWAPELWPFFFHRFYPSGGDGLSLYAHVTGDFGTRGMPGVFKIFFVDVVVNMARAAMVLKGPLPCYVDDVGRVAAVARASDHQMLAFQNWVEAVCGVSFQRLKDRAGSQVQLMLGFWWNSFDRTRTLEDSKLAEYLAMLLDFSTRRSLSLRERQQVAGRMQRATMTMPPGAACLMANMYALMAGLKMGWQQRRTTGAERADYRFFHDVLASNAGQGFFCHQHFKEGPGVQSDASRQRRYSGGGWVSATGDYDWYTYGAAAAKRPIDFLEGDTVVQAVERMGHAWRGMRIAFGVDNQAFQKSAVKGWARAERLSLLLKRLFVLQIHFGCILQFYWISSADNYLADHLSRQDGLAAFIAVVRGSGFLLPGVSLRPQPDAGRVRTLDMSAPLRSTAMVAFFAQARPAASFDWLSRVMPCVVRLQATVRGWLTRRVIAAAPWMLGVAWMAVPAPRAARARVRAARAVSWRRSVLLFMTLLRGGAAGARDGASAQLLSVPYPRASMYTGLPVELLDRLDEVIDNRLAPSSMRTLNAAMALWRPLVAHHGWPVVIVTDDPARAGKLAAFVLHMLDQCDLVGDTISSYVWGVRWYMKLQRQTDPLFGVMNWHDFMTGVRVLSHVTHEPRRAVPIALLRQVAGVVDLDSFVEVQHFFFDLVLFYTFSRSECPCPKHFTGEESWDDNQHWMVRDLVFRCITGIWVLAVRFKAIKQDPRIERPAARGDGSDRGASRRGGSDWSYIGDVPGDTLSPFLWYRRLMGFYDGPREETAPFFMASDRTRPYTYTAAHGDLKRLIRRVQVDDDFGLHGLRVEGYNRAKSAVGEDLAVAHGGWKPGSNSRYDRFNLRSVFKIAKGMARAHDGSDSDDSSDDGAVQPRPIRRTAGAVRGTVVVAPAARPVADSDGEGEGVPAHVVAARRIEADPSVVDQLMDAVVASPPARAVTRLLSRATAPLAAVAQEE